VPDRGWLRRFNAFWTRQLGRKTLDEPDFHYRRCWLREQVREATAWTQTVDEYQLLAQVWREACHPWRAHRLLPWLPRRRGTVLEFGCGIAPVAWGLRRWPWRWSRWDRPESLALSYADWRAGGPTATWPGDHRPFGGILALEVLEHLEHPAATLTDFERWLLPGGRLIADFAEERTPHGLNRASAQAQRPGVLARLAAPPWTPRRPVTERPGVWDYRP